MGDFKEIKGFDFYKINKHGVVMRYNKPLKHYLKSGYPFVILCINNKPHNKYIHRLIAENFIPNPDNKPFVNHKNFNPLDYSIENLEWVTQKENIHHSLSAGRYKIGENAYQTRLSKNDIIAIRKEYSEGGCNQTQLGLKYGVVQTTISCIVKRKSFKSID